MLRATPGWRRMSPARSNVSTIWCTQGGLHASWLNMVEIEIGVLKGQCLDRRINNEKDLEREIAAWQRERQRRRRPREMDVHDREGPRQNRPRLPETDRHPRP